MNFLLPFSLAADFEDDHGFNMKISTMPSLLICLAVSTSYLSADEKPLSVSEVLKHSPEELAQKLGNSSEAGEDHAARLWAVAKRSETDSFLGKSSVQAMQRLNEWRQMLNTWQDLKLRARGIESGGGTMWSHLSARNDAYIEGFLAKHLTTLSAPPKADGKPFKPNYLKPIYATIDAGVKEFGQDQEHIQKQAVSLKEELQNTYYTLQYLLQSLPEGKTKQAVIKMLKPSAE